MNEAYGLTFIVLLWRIESHINALKDTYDADDTPEVFKFRKSMHSGGIFMYL